MSSSLLSRTNNLPSTIRVDNASMDRKTYIPSDLNIDSALTMESTPSRTSLVSPPDIDKVIQGFQQELDTLSRSFDLLSSHSKRSRSQNSETHSQRFHSTPVPQPPPPPSARPPAQSRRADADSQNRLNLSRADETVFTQTTTKTPKPVETPATSPRHRTYAEVPHQDRTLFPSSSSTSDLQATVQTMQELMNEQSATILKLKRENNELRKQLLEAQYPRETTREPMLESSNRHRNNYQTPYTRSRYSEDRNGNDTIRSDRRYIHNNSYYEDEMKPSVSSLTSFPRQDDDENTLETNPPPPQSRLRNTAGAQLQTDFTPGTKFVAELSKYMTLPSGHSVPLSVIIDRNWDKLKYHMRDESGPAGL